MKNYLARLALPRKSSESTITNAIATAMENTGDIQSLRDAQNILSEKVKRAYYERTHLQYEAISAAIDCLKAPGARDTHHWPERIAEFDRQLSDDLVNQQRDRSTPSGSG